MVTAATDRVVYSFANGGSRIDVDHRSPKDYVKVAGMAGGGIAPTKIISLDRSTGGSTFRRSRRLARQMDFPIAVGGNGRQELEDKLRALLWVLQDDDSSPSLIAHYPNGQEFALEAHYQSGFDYTWGSADTDGKTLVRLPLVLWCPDPYWSSTTETVSGVSTTTNHRGLLQPGGGGLSKLRLGSSSAAGTITVQNSGDIDAQPVWTLRGPGNVFTAQRSDGLWFSLGYTFGANDTITIDTRTKEVYDQNGQNLYPYLNDVPKFFSIPRGRQTVQARLDGATGASSVTLSFIERRELVF